MITIEKVTNKRQLNEFIQFYHTLYAGNKYYAPPLDKMERDFFSPKNPMAKDCDVQLWLAKEGITTFGRIAGIINRAYNEKSGERQARFTHFDCLDSQGIASLLLSTVEKWALDKGMKTVVGPFGYNNLDRHGMLVQGFEELACQSSNYNEPYYPKFMDALGYTKRCDWLELQVTVPDEKPERVAKFSKIISEKWGVRTLNIKNHKDIRQYASRIFDLYTNCHTNIYGSVPLDEPQKQKLIKNFISVLTPDFVSVVVNEADEMVAFGIAMMSVSRTLQKANGKLFPLGFLHFLQNSKNNGILDLLLIGVHPDYQKKGVNILIFNDFYQGIVKNKVKIMETTQVLESNHASLNQWSRYEYKEKKRSRLYEKSL